MQTLFETNFNGNYASDNFFPTTSKIESDRRLGSGAWALFVIPLLVFVAVVAFGVLEPL